MIFGFISLISASIATFVGLKVRPLEDRLMKLETSLTEHLKIIQDVLLNYNRWRGEVTAELRLQTELLQKILHQRVEEDDNRRLRTKDS